MMTADKIKKLIGTLSGVSLVDDFTIDEAGSLKGRIAVATGQDNKPLMVIVVIMAFGQD